MLCYHIESRQACNEHLEQTTSVETDDDHNRGDRKKKKFPEFVPHSKCIADNSC